MADEDRDGMGWEGCIMIVGSINGVWIWEGKVVG